MEKELIYSTPSLPKAFASHLFDLLALALLTALLASGAYPLYFLTPSYREPSSFRKEIMLNSHLYVESGDGVATLPSYLKGEDSLTFQEKSDSVSSSLKYCYTVYLNPEFEGKGEERLLSFYPSFEKEGRPLFSESGARLLLDAYYDEAYFEAYSEILERKAVGDLGMKGGFVAARKGIIAGYLVVFFLCFSLSMALLFYAVPLLCHRGRKTLGMLLTRLGYVDSRGLSPSLMRFSLRFLFLWVLIGIASFLSFLAPFCLSAAFFAFRKDRQTLTDYVSGVYLVDADKLLIPEKAEEA